MVDPRFISFPLRSARQTFPLSWKESTKKKAYVNKNLYGASTDDISLTIIQDECKEMYTNDDIILRRNSECFGHDKPFFPKMKVQGLEELFDIFQIPGDQAIVK
jgi:hypothetical protein